MTLTTPPTAPVRTMTQAVFDAAYAAWIAWQATNVTEFNNEVALLNAGSGMGAIAIAYTFSTTTTDADPGNGVLRLDNATQNTATVIRADLLDSGGATVTPVLDTFDDTSGTVKGYIRLVKASDSTKWLVFSVSALASPSGYKNITVANIGSSAASPFANSDALILYFTPLNVVNNSVGDHSVTVHTGNGHGSTNTKIRRFTTAMVNTGTAITYADSATLGASFTINDTGIYEVCYEEPLSGAGAFGVSLNSAALTTSIATIPVATRMAYAFHNNASGFNLSVTRTLRLSASDVIRPHTDGAIADTTDKVFFSIRKVGF